MVSPHSFHSEKEAGAFESEREPPFHFRVSPQWEMRKSPNPVAMMTCRSLLFKTENSHVDRARNRSANKGQTSYSTLQFGNKTCQDSLCISQVCLWYKDTRIYVFLKLTRHQFPQLSPLMNLDIWPQLGKFGYSTELQTRKSGPKLKASRNNECVAVARTVGQ